MKETTWETWEWMVMKFRVPWRPRNFFIQWNTLILSRVTLLLRVSWGSEKSCFRKCLFWLRWAGFDSSGGMNLSLWHYIQIGSSLHPKSKCKTTCVIEIYNTWSVSYSWLYALILYFGRGPNLCMKGNCVCKIKGRQFSDVNGMNEGMDKSVYAWDYNL
jgi:hypothetical protein